jgi:hypothetical protein
MPGATEISIFRKERSMTVDGPTMASLRGFFGTAASADEVIAFYTGELARLGWIRDRLAVNKGSLEIEVEGWCKNGGRTFKVAIQDPERVVRHDASGRPFRTLFDAGLIGVDPAQACGRS